MKMQEIIDKLKEMNDDEIRSTLFYLSGIFLSEEENIEKYGKRESLQVSDVVDCFNSAVEHGIESNSK